MTTLHDLFPGRYLVGEDLNGQDVTVTIRRVEVEEMGRLDKKGETTQKPVVYFNGLDKGLVLNKTNAVTVAKMYGDVIEKWYGQAVTLYPKQEHAFGSTWTVIRIRPRRPDGPPTPERLGKSNGAAPAVNRETGELLDAPPTPSLNAEYVRLYAKAYDLGIPLTAKDGTPMPPALPPSWSDKLCRRALDYVRGLVEQAEAQPASPAAAVPDYEGSGEPHTEGGF